MKLLLSLMICFWWLHSTSSLEADERPNVLWIIAEDMGPELGCYGTQGIQTPVLDDLAKRGMLFRKAYTVTAVCSTSRSSFMTGMYAMSIGAHNHRSHRDGKHPLPEGVKVLTDWLRPAGYYTANIKTLTDDPKLKKFYQGTGKTDWNFTYTGKAGPFDSHQWDELKTHQPFYAQINFSETHRGGAWNNSHQQIDQIADPAEIEIPPYYPEHSVTRAIWAQYFNTVMAVDKKVQFILELLKRDQLDKNTIVVFLGDHGRAMPRSKQWPYESGLHIPFIVYWPESNPEFPPPAGYKRGTKSDQLVASIDLTASTIDWAGLRKPEKMQGQILFGPRADPARTVVFGGRDRGDETVLHIRTVRNERYRYLLNGYPERPFLQLNRYKETSYPIIGLMRYLHARGQLSGPPLQLMADTRPREELYDLEADPWEIHNLADEPGLQKLKQEMSRQLSDWQAEIDDQGRIPEPQELTDAIERDYAKKYAAQYENRPEDWFINHPALGPYPVQLDH